MEFCSVLLAACERNPEFWYFLYCWPQQSYEKTVDLLVIWDSRLCDITVMNWFDMEEIMKMRGSKLM